ncbi:hypothetical protein FOZ60_007120 [Perkinsus olseni]|uniref:CCHC-type domain-containing protein n=1 Tax=Perkinsus olseni TaxID=32597 RepID=A0A7J6NM63_PEROL|nr:hypothetical protein FOZ60_007120 [Perkinsus olseni]
MSGSGLVSGATSGELQSLASYMGISLDLVDQLRMTDLDSVHAQDANISFVSKVGWLQEGCCYYCKEQRKCGCLKLISRAKDAGKVSGGEVDSMDEYACGSDAFKYFYLRASLDEDIRGYVNKEVKAKINKEDLATQLEWDKLTYTPGSTRMESHLTKLLTLADRVSMSRGSSAVASYAAMRREVRRWAQYNEKPVSAANAAEENDIEVGLSIALGDMDKDACWRCGLKGHRAFECRGASTICGRCKQPGHYSATCDAELPVKRFNTRGGRGRRNPPVMVVTAEGDTVGTSDSVPAACDSSGSADCTSVPVMQVDLMAVGARSDGQEPLDVKIVPPAELCVDVAGKSVKFLIDSGAGLNFISEALATELSALSSQPFRPLVRELRVVFGNDHKVLVSKGLELPLTVTRHGEKECILFMVLHLLRVLRRWRFCNIEPVETIEVAGKGKRLLAHCPRLEESNPELHVEPQRRRSDRERKAIYRLLCLMEKEDKVVRLQPGQAWTNNEVVLVAKKGAEVTLDLRFTNKIGTSTPSLESEDRIMGPTLVA